MDLLQHFRDREEILAIAEDIKNEARDFSKTLSDTHRPEPGPYAIFSHLSQFHKRMKQLRLVVSRLYDRRYDLLKIAIVQHTYRPRNWEPGVPYPTEFQKISQEQRQLDDELELDFETMLIFASMTVDEISQITAYALGLERPEKFTHSTLCRELRERGLPNEFDAAIPSLIWLDNFLRTYRNKFIMHRELPWQISHSSSVYGLDWAFFSPIPPGWLSAEDKASYRSELEELARSFGLTTTSSNHRLVEQLLNHVSIPVDWVAREKLLKIASIVGFRTPSFHRFARMTLEYLLCMMKILHSQIRTNPSAVNIGMPPWKRANIPHVAQLR